mgnify:CR=1 FL=1
MTRIFGPLHKSAAVLTLALGVLAFSARPAHADITAFLGLSPTPQRHSVTGLGVGVGLVIVGFEFEYANITEDPLEKVPGLKTYSGNVLMQTPTPNMQFYATAGVEGYQERLNLSKETSVGTNVGGGAKIGLLGPLRVRVDYRIFKLLGSPTHDMYQRFYVGANLNF